jgi:Spy/CpxP family protein refolding chaperone
MKRLIFPNALVIVVLLCIPGLALADEREERERDEETYSRSGMMGEHRMKGHQMMRRGHMSFSPIAMKEQLGLSQEQVDALQPLETDYRKFQIKKSAAMRIAMIDLGALLDNKEPAKGELKKTVDEITGVQRDLMMYRVETLLKLKEILTPDQYSQFRAVIKKQMRRGGMMGRMHGMGGMMGGE